MTTIDHRTIIERDIKRLAELLASHNPSAPVPSCADWTVAELITHTSTVHRMAAAALSDAPLVDGRPAIEHYDGEKPLADWVVEGGSALIAAIDAAELDAPSWTFMGERPKSFWLRRMAAETAIHRWDAQNAHGIADPLDPVHAVDVVDEFLDVFVPRKPADAFADAEGRTLHLHANDADGEWVITRHTAGIDIERAHSKSTTAIRGTASSLALFVWNRPLPDDIEVFGDESQLAEWAERMQF